MTSLLVLGAGGHGSVVAEAALDQGGYDEISFLDDRFPEIAEAGGFQVIGQISRLDEFPTAEWEVVVAFGDNPKRVALVEAAIAQGFRCPAVVHPAAFVSRSATLAEGVVIMAGAVICAGVRMGRGCIANTGCTVDHDCVLGEGVHVSPGANLAGDVHVGDCSWIGIGATVNQCLQIGAGATVGASTGVIRDVPDGVCVVGLPARQI